MLRDKPTSQAMTRCRSARTLSKRSANRTAAPGTEMESAFAAYVIIITDPNPICLPLTCTRIVRLRPKLVSEIASAATASANQPAFRLASTCKDSARVWRSMTMTLIRTAMASAASRLRRTWNPRGACAGTRCWPGTATAASASASAGASTPSVNAGAPRASAREGRVVGIRDKIPRPC